MTPTNKTCKICGEDKPTTEFHKNTSTKDGLHYYCKPCNCNNTKRSYRKRRYGLSEEAYEDVWVKAASKCAICGDTLTRVDNYCHAIDHNHKTGEVRGLLCNHCNLGLGHFKDSPSLLAAAKAYLDVRGHYGDSA